MNENRLRSKYVEYYNPLSINPPKQRVTKHRADFFSSFFPCQTRCATVTRKFIGRHDFARVREPVDQKEEAEAWSLEAIKGSIFRKSTRSPYRAIRRNHAWKRVRGVQGKCDTGFEDEEEEEGEGRNELNARSTEKEWIFMNALVCTRTVIESEKCYREWESRRSHFKIECINLPCVSKSEISWREKSSFPDLFNYR